MKGPPDPPPRYDDVFWEGVAALNKLAGPEPEGEAMTSRITSEGPALLERHHEVLGTTVYVTKLPDDPVCLRVSLGGAKEFGFYLVYRGDEKQVGHLLAAALTAFLEKS